EGQHAPIDRSREAVALEAERADERGSGARQGEAERGPDQREDGALRHDEPYEANAARPERRAHRELAPASGETGELQVRDVRAGDQEHGEHDRLQNEQHLLEIADTGLAQGPGLAGEARDLYDVRVDAAFVHVATH